MNEAGIDDIRAYGQRLQQALREGSEQGTGRWRELVEQGLAAAYAQGDIVGLCDVVQAIVSLLDAQGRQREAIAEIEYAVSISGGEPNALAMLLSMRATFQATSGSIGQALRSVQEAERSLPQADLEFARGKCRANCSVVRWIALDTSAKLPDELTLQTPSDTRTSDSLFLTSFFIPLGFALGKGAEMRPWIRAFRLQSAAVKHEYRLGDASVFQAAEEGILGLVELPALETIPRWNWLAQWRLEALRLRAQMLRRDWDSTMVELRALVRARRRAGDACVDDIGGLEAACQAYFDDGERLMPILEPPDSLHLLNLASVLAAAEAMAVGGTRAAAGDWADWLDKNAPQYIVTSLEWPVSRARIGALLALRCGDARRARKLFEGAIEWAKSAEHPIELAIAQLQLSELLGKDTLSLERLSVDLRRQAVPVLRGIGVDIAPLAYHVAHIHPRGKDALLTPQLTPREVDVLVALADGLTYRSTAVRLGVKWTTVQTLAHRCYEKLEASGKQAAVARARELGIL
jgi:DNA-binding NarL/FixJ family response regulator